MSPTGGRLVLRDRRPTGGAVLALAATLTFGCARPIDLANSGSPDSELAALVDSERRGGSWPTCWPAAWPRRRFRSRRKARTSVISPPASLSSVTPGRCPAAGPGVSQEARGPDVDGLRGARLRTCAHVRVTEPLRAG